VIVGYQEGEMVEILSGLTGSEQVVITGHQNLRDQAPVEVVNNEIAFSNLELAKGSSQIIKG
jgi:hypothetical protein